MAKIDAFFQLMHDQGASDLHLVSGQQPVIRTRGEMERVKFDVLTNDALKAMLYEIAPEHKIKQFEESGDIDFAYEIPGLARYRANFFQQQFGCAAVFREIPTKIMTAVDLGLPPVVSKLASLPRGLVLVTGPTGSGKTTTLYSALTELNQISENISTAEDPVEYNLMGINQVQIHEEIGLSFAHCLRSFLRQDPDIIMVGEVRDFETAEIAIKAALTGHMVLSTLHTNDAPSTISRLLNMGIEPFLVASAVNLIVAQRLARRICDACKAVVQVSPQMLVNLGIPPEELNGLTCYKGAGCSRCSNTGYKGRIALYEVLRVGDEVREQILQGASAGEIKKEAVQQGMKTLRQAALQKLREGVTSVEEILKTTVED